MKHLVAILLFCTLSASAQRKMSTNEYVDLYKDIAIQKMQSYGIPASITLAQALLESGTGSSELALKANNHFGIKCGKSWTGPRVYHDDDEKDDCFRKYSTVEESYRDHSIFLKESARYASLFTLSVTDYRGWAHGLKKAGYATNPRYADILIDLVERYELQKWDRPQTLGGIIGSAIHVGEGDAPRPMARTGLTWGYVNGVKYVVTRKGDTYSSLARRLRMPLERLLKFNDLTQTIPLKEGQKVFIKLKKGKNMIQNVHIVKQGETSYSIAQDFGIRLKAMKRKNPRLKSNPPAVGQRIIF